MGFSVSFMFVAIAVRVLPWVGGLVYCSDLLWVGFELAIDWLLGLASGAVLVCTLLWVCVWMTACMGFLRRCGFGLGVLMISCGLGLMPCCCGWLLFVAVAGRLACGVCVSSFDVVW